MDGIVLFISHNTPIDKVTYRGSTVEANSRVQNTNTILY